MPPPEPTAGRPPANRRGRTSFALRLVVLPVLGVLTVGLAVVQGRTAAAIRNAVSADEAADGSLVVLRGVPQVDEPVRIDGASHRHEPLLYVRGDGPVPVRWTPSFRLENLTVEPEGAEVIEPEERAVTVGHPGPTRVIRHDVLRATEPVTVIGELQHGSVRRGRLFYITPVPRDELAQTFEQRSEGSFAGGVLCWVLALGWTFGTRLYRRARAAFDVLAPDARRSVWVLAGVSALTRGLTLARYPADIDETVSWFHLNTALGERGFWDTFALGVDAPLYPAVNAAVAAVAGTGTSVEVLRVPAALFGVGMVLLFYGVVRRLQGPRVGLAAGLLAAVSPFLSYYGKTARPYSQMSFFCMLFTYAFFATERWRHAWIRALLLAALTAAAVASHYFALVYFATFYGIVLLHHGRLRQTRRVVRETFTGALSLAAVIPLVWALVVSVERLPLQYWTWAGLNLVTVIVEQVTFTGLVGMLGLPLTLASAVLLVVLVAPLGAALAGRLPRPDAHPLLIYAGFGGPVAVELGDLIAGGDHLFFPRGFIASTPFLLSYIVIVAGTVPPGTLRRLWLGAIAAPFVLSAVLIGAGLPFHPSYAARRMGEPIMEEVRKMAAGCDWIVVHHWGMAPYFAYFLGGRERERVIPLGLYEREIARRDGEAAAIRAAVDQLPRDARLLVVLNSVAGIVDPDNELLGRIEAGRPLEAKRPCDPNHREGIPFLCDRLIQLGPATTSVPPAARR